MASGGWGETPGTGGLGQFTPALPPQDLCDDGLLHRAPRVEFLGAARPAPGGIVLLARLGQGGMGAVYYGVNPRLGRGVAVKVLPFHLLDRNPDLVQRFFREAQAAARVHSPNLVGVYDVNQDHGVYYLVLEYVHGVSAWAYVKQVKQGGAVGLPEAQALELCIAAATGMAAAHECGIIHRDIKPHNILIPKSPQGDELDFRSAKLADLGLARSEESETALTNAAQCIGTPGFVAPEQIENAHGARKSADVFSMGATLYALLAGQSPFHAASVMKMIEITVLEAHPSVRHVRPDVSTATACLIDVCLAKDPQRRYQDAADLLSALKECQAGRTALPPVSLRPTRRMAEPPAGGQAVERGASARPEAEDLQQTVSAAAAWSAAATPGTSQDDMPTPITQTTQELAAGVGEGAAGAAPEEAPEDEPRPFRLPPPPPEEERPKVQPALLIPPQEAEEPAGEEKGPRASARVPLLMLLALAVIAYLGWRFGYLPWFGAPPPPPEDEATEAARRGLFHGTADEQTRKPQGKDEKDLEKKVPVAR